MAGPQDPAERIDPAHAEAAPLDPAAVHLTQGTLDTVVDQLRQAKSQLHTVNRLIEKGGDCVDIVTQMAAVSEVLDRVGFAVISAGLKQCITDSPKNESVDTSSLEKLFLSLA